MEAYVEHTSISSPLEWLQENDWTYMSDYFNKYEYTHYDDMYRLILGEISWDDYASYGYPEQDREEVKRVYQENFPKLMADAMIAIARDIKDGSLVIKFDEIDEEG